MCPVCRKGKAQYDPTLNLVLPCQSCQAKRKANDLPHPVEMVGESIKKERATYAKSIIQPFNRFGDFSAEYYESYGTKGVKVTTKQVKERKRIWDKDFSKNVDLKATK